MKARRNPLGQLPLHESFCCGFPIALAGRLVLWAHFIWVAVVVGLTTVSFFAQVKAVGLSQLQTIIFFAYALAGLPITLGGIGGSLQGLWIYWFYLIGTCAWQTYLLLFVVQEAVHVKLQGMSLSVSGGCAGFQEWLTPRGQNVACSIFEAYEVGVIVFLVLFQVYIVWTVWSFIRFVEEHQGGEREALLALSGAQAKSKAALFEPRYPPRLGQFCRALGCPLACMSLFVRPGMGDFIDGDLTLPREPYIAIGVDRRSYDPATTAYMNIHGKGLDGSEKIFGGPCHDMRYPPPARF